MGRESIQYRRGGGGGVRGSRRGSGLEGVFFFLKGGILGLGMMCWEDGVCPKRSASGLEHGASIRLCVCA